MVRTSFLQKENERQEEKPIASRKRRKKSKKALPHLPRVCPALYTVPDSPVASLLEKLGGYDLLLPTTSAEEKASNEQVSLSANAKGASTYSSTGSACLDLFFKGMCRNCETAEVESLLEAAWQENPHATIQILLNGRDCRSGKGERAVVLSALLWLRRNKPKTYLLNLEEFVAMGYYKDLLHLAQHALLQQEDSKNNDDDDDDKDDDKDGKDNQALVLNDVIELELLAAQLKRDLHTLAKQDQGEGGKKVSISLAGKWAPTANSVWDRKTSMTARVARLLFPPSQPNRMQGYRKVCSGLRSHIKVVESLMCANRWEDIEFGSVPSKAHKNLKKAFARQQADRYKEYLEKLTTGKAVIKSAGLQPHELVREYMQPCSSLCPTTEGQWKDLVAKVAQCGSLKNAVCVVDVSGSMSGQPMEAAIALGLVATAVTTGAYRGRVITFDSNPTWHPVDLVTSLKSQVDNCLKMPWGGSTNLQATFEMILSFAQERKVHANQMPESLFIFSDMQFDQACRNNNMVLPVIRAKFSAAGYACPNLVFWNLAGNTPSGSFPVTMREDGVALMSGFSAELLKVFLEGGSFSPLAVLQRTIVKYAAKVSIDEA